MKKIEGLPPPVVEDEVRRPPPPVVEDEVIRPPVVVENALRRRFRIGNIAEYELVQG